MATKGAAKGTLNAHNLQALGEARFADLLLELSEGNAAAKRVLRLALAEQKGPTEMARQVRERLATTSPIASNRLHRATRAAVNRPAGSRSCAAAPRRSPPTGGRQRAE